VGTTLSGVAEPVGRGLVPRRELANVKPDGGGRAPALPKLPAFIRRVVLVAVGAFHDVPLTLRIRPPGTGPRPPPSVAGRESKVLCCRREPLTPGDERRRTQYHAPLSDGFR